MPVQGPSNTDAEQRVHDAIYHALTENSDEWFEELLDAVCAVTLPDGTHALANTQHPLTGATALMVASARCRIAHVMSLLNLGADPSIRANRGKTALDWALCAGEAGADVVEVRPFLF